MEKILLMTLILTGFIFGQSHCTDQNLLKGLTASQVAQYKGYTDLVNSYYQKLDSICSDQEGEINRLAPYDKYSKMDFKTILSIQNELTKEYISYSMKLESMKIQKLKKLISPENFIDNLLSLASLTIERIAETGVLLFEIFNPTVKLPDIFTKKIPCKTQPQ